MDDINQVKNYYDEDVDREWLRLENHRIEFEINKRFIYKYIHSGDSVLDIGGGPGRYSLDMAKNGCDVTLFDLSQGNIDFAKTKASEYGVNIKAVCGDARFVDTIIKEQFDAILLMGPMYHIPDDDDRIKTMEAAIRLLKPNGIIFVAFISSYAALWDYLTYAPEAIIDERAKDYYDAVVNDKCFSGQSFTAIHFIRPKDVLPFMERFSLEKLHLLGSESVLATREVELMAQPQDVLTAWLDFTEKICEREEFLSLAHHFLYIGRK